MEVLERRSTLAVESELTTLSGTAGSSGTTVTFTTAQTLEVGQVIGLFAKGFRRIVTVTDTTHVVVDSAFDSALSADTVLLQSYAVDPTIAAANCLEFVSPFGLEPARSVIERNVVRNTFDKLASIAGDETVTGDITVEMHNSGTAGSVADADPLWLSAIGERTTSTASTTHASTPCTTTSLVLVASGGLGFKVGDAVCVDVSAGGTGVYEVAWITVIATDTLTITPALSLAPPTGRAVLAGVHYKLSKNELKSFWCQFWRGDVVRETYRGCKVSNLAIDYPVGGIILPKFTVQAKDTAAPVSESYTLGAATYDSGAPHIGRYMVIRMKIGGGSMLSTPLSAATFNLANELYRVTDLTSAGTLRYVRTQRLVSGTFQLLYENSTIEDAFRAGTNAELILVSSAGASALTPGNIAAVRIPIIRYTTMTKPVDAGIYKYDIAWEAAPNLGEDTITSFSLL